MSSLKVVTFTNKNINKYFLIFSWNYKFSLKSRTYNLLWIVPEHGKTLDKKVRAYALKFLLTIMFQEKKFHKSTS